MTGGGAMPDVHLEVESTHYPRGVSRDRDSLAMPPLKKRDQVWETDKACTYKRDFHFDAGQNRYVTDKPLPDACSFDQG